MAIEIREIGTTKRELLKFVQYPIDFLYRNSKQYVPDLISDMLNTVDPAQNPAFDFCEAVYFMAYRDGRPVGRIAGIINRVVNEREHRPEARFGFVDFIDDDEVVDALFDAVARWAKQKGMTQLTGPLGFTDMDKEGCLIEGFDELGTQETIYNYPYYSKQIERMGFQKDADWVEFKVFVPEQTPEKMHRMAQIVAKRYGVHSVRNLDRKTLVRRYGDQIFHLINDAYDKLFGYSPLSEKQIKHYIDIYLPMLPLDHISIVVNDNDEAVGVGISIPSLSEALIRCRGRFLPLGWWHMLRAMRGKTDVVDLLLIAVKPELQGAGINAIFFDDLVPVYIQRGYKWAESNPELESNDKVQRQWQYFRTEQHRRRRAYTKPL